MCVCVQSLSCVWFFATPWIVAHHVPLSKGFPRQEHWSGLPFPSSGELPDPRTELISPALASEFLTTQPPKKPWPGNYPFYYNNTWLSQIGDTENIPSWKNEVLFLHLFDDTQKKMIKMFLYINITICWKYCTHEFFSWNSKHFTVEKSLGEKARVMASTLCFSTD